MDEPIGSAVRRLIVPLCVLVAQPWRPLHPALMAAVTPPPLRYRHRPRPNSDSSSGSGRRRPTANSDEVCWTIRRTARRSRDSRRRAAPEPQQMWAECIWHSHTHTQPPPPPPPPPARRSRSRSRGRSPRLPRPECPSLPSAAVTTTTRPVAVDQRQHSYSHRCLPPVAAAVIWLTPHTRCRPRRHRHSFRCRPRRHRLHLQRVNRRQQVRGARASVALCPAAKIAPTVAT